MLVETDTADRAAAIVLAWVNQEHRDTQTWAHLFASVQPVLDETKPATSVRLYRNERRNDEGQYDRFTSWTTDAAMATDYPAGGGRNRQLVSAMIAPKDMVCFIPAFGSRVDWLGQQEMIVRPGRYERVPAMAVQEAVSTGAPRRIKLYHSTDEPIDMAQCLPFTHFGNRRAALRRIAWKVEGRRQRGATVPNYLYGVVFVTAKPLWIHDAGFNHNWPALVAAIVRAIDKSNLEWPTRDRFRRALPGYGDPDFAGRLARAVRDLGYDSLAYRNRAEGGNSYVALGPENIAEVVSSETITGDEAIDRMA
jgi:hypothetical protein